jgi:aminotransferase
MEAGFRCKLPRGAYYILADFSGLSDRDDTSFAKWLAYGGSDPSGGPGVAPVPGSSFFHDPALGRHLVRFAFCKKPDTLNAAAARLISIAREK